MKLFCFVRHPQLAAIRVTYKLVFAVDVDSCACHRCGQNVAELASHVRLLNVQEPHGLEVMAGGGG